MSGSEEDWVATVSRETLERLRAFHDLLLQWTRRINLIASSTRSDAWTRHIADSLQLWQHAPEDARTWIDLGSGGGLPGLVIAIVAAEKNPSLSITLVESDQRKAAFLLQCKQRLGLPVDIHNDRIEHLPAMPQDVVSARALAPLPRLLTLSQRFRHPRTVLLFPKGRRADFELTEARRHWHIEVEEIPSRTDPEGKLLKIVEVGPLT